MPVRPLARAATLVVVVLTAACSAKLEVDDLVAINCGSAGECPSGRVCAADLGRCVVPGQSCVSADGGSYRAVPNGNQCPLAGGDGICIAGACQRSVCGDGYADTLLGESCDDGSANNDTTPNVCRTNCQAAHCGDGVVDPAKDEACDDGNTTSGDGCTATCNKIEVCGDRVTDVGEDCDDGNANANDGCNACDATTWVADVVTGLGLGGGNATRTATFLPENVTYDALGNLYIGERARVRRLDASGAGLTPVAGTGEQFSGTPPDSTPATQALLYRNVGLVVDGNRRVFLLESSSTLRMVDTTGQLRRIAGRVGMSCTGVDTCGDGQPASSMAVTISGSSLAIDGRGNVYIASAARVRKIDMQTNLISTVVGTGNTCASGACGDGGVATSATFGSVTGVAMGSDGSLYLVDSANRRIRKTTSLVVGGTPTIAGFAGTGAACASGTCGEGAAALGTALNLGPSIAIDRDDNVYFVDLGATGAPLLRIRKIAAGTGIITTVVGAAVCSDPTGVCGDGGPVGNAQLRDVRGIAVADDGSLAIAQLDNRVRVVRNGVITTVVGNGNGADLPIGAAATSAFVSTNAAALGPAGETVVLGEDSKVIYGVPATRPQLAVLAGITESGVVDPGADEPASSTNFVAADIAVDSAGNVFYLEDTGGRVRRLDRVARTIATIAGTGSSCAAPTGACGDGPNARLATLSLAKGIAITPDDDLLIADTNAFKVRRVDMQSCSAANGWQCAISTIAGNGSYGFVGNGIPATTAQLACPWDVSADADGTVYVAEPLGCAVRSIGTDGAIRAAVSRAQTASCPVVSYPDDGCTRDSLPSSENFLSAIAVRDGDLFYGDNAVVRRLTRGGSDTVVLGGGSVDSDGLAGPQLVTGTILRLESRPGALIATELHDLVAGQVRLMDTQSLVTRTVAGNVDAKTGGPLAISALGDALGVLRGPVDGSFLVADGSNGRVRRVDVTNDWADVVFGYPGNAADVTPRAARYAQRMTIAHSLAYDTVGQVLFVLEETMSGFAIHKVSMADVADSSGWQAVRWLSGNHGAQLDHPSAIAFSSITRQLYVADTGNNLVRAIAVDDASPAYTIVAGRVGYRGFYGESVPATDAVLDSPRGLTVAPDGTLYIADTANNRVRWIDSTDLIHTVMGDGTAASSGEGAPAASFPVDTPRGLAFDTFGNLFITSRNAVRLVEAAPAGSSMADQAVQTIYGAYPRSAYPDAITDCLAGVSVSHDDATAVVIDQCKGLMVRLTRSSL